MKYFLTLLTTILFLMTLNAQSIDKSEFCLKCKCNIAEKSVKCNDVSIGSNISELIYWQNPDTNITYDFIKISVRNSGLIHLMPLPESPVKVLDLSRNKIEVIENGCFMYMQNLTEIDLSDNDLTSELFVPDIFKGVYADDEYLPLKSMRILRLGNNQLHTLHQDIFEHIMNLEILDLHGNALRIIDMQTLIAITKLRSLKRLDLSYTYLKKLPDGILHTSKKISEVDLSGNLFTTVPSQLSEAVNLRYLSLNENPIVNITAENGFPVMKNLRILHLSFMDNLTRIENGALSGLTGLKELYISDNKCLTYLGSNALVHNDSGTEIWPLITKLNLKNNKLSYLSHQFLARWDQFEEIEISGNAWSCDCDNNWLIETVVKDIVEKNRTTHEIWCSAPQELEGKTLQDIYKEKRVLRCLDMYGGHPERDASILIGILIGLLTGIPLVLGLLFCYKKKFFGYFNEGPAAFSRKFYNRAENEEEFYS